MGLGRKTSSVSETTSIVDSVVPGWPMRRMIRDIFVVNRREIAYGDGEKVERDIVTDNRNLGPLIFVWDAIEALEDGARGGGDHS